MLLDKTREHFSDLGSKTSEFQKALSRYPAVHVEYDQLSDYFIKGTTCKREKLDVSIVERLPFPSAILDAIDTAAASQFSVTR